MSRVMIAEATPGPFLGADLADSSFKQCEVRGQKLLTVPCQRLAALPNHEVAAARIVVALRTHRRSSGRRSTRQLVRRAKLSK